MRWLAPGTLLLAALLGAGCKTFRDTQDMTVTMTGSNLNAMRLLVTQSGQPATSPGACGTSIGQAWCSVTTSSSAHQVATTVDHSVAPYTVYAVNNDPNVDRSVTIVIVVDGREILRHTVDVFAGTITKAAEVY